MSNGRTLRRCEVVVKSFSFLVVPVPYKARRLWVSAPRDRLVGAIKIWHDRPHRRGRKTVGGRTAEGVNIADFTTRATRARARRTTAKLVIIRPYFFVASKKKTAAPIAVTAMARWCRLGSLGLFRRGRSTGHFPTIKRQRNISSLSSCGRQ